MNKVRSVHKLHKNDIIGLFSPSEPLTDERQIRMEPSLNLLKQFYRVKWGDNAFNSMYYQAGDTNERLNDIVDLISDPDVNAMMASWGGKNGSQLISKLPYELFKKRRIPIIGFSDTCVLLNPISVFSDIITFYGPNIAGKLTESTHYDLSDLWTGYYSPFGNTSKEQWTTINEGTCIGKLYGGNLSTFTIALAGSQCLKHMKDIVFFWESAGDPPQIIDQYLTGLENACFFDRVKAMVVGKVLYDEIERKNRPLQDLLHEYGQRYNIPVVQINNFGHCKTENPIIPIGATVSLNTDKKVIELLQSVVF